MSKSKRVLTGEEAQLWRRAAQNIAPRARAKAPKAEAPPLPAKGPIARAPRPEPARTSLKPPPADRGGEKRVRRGKLEIGAQLDLHGHTQDTAHAALARFLHAARERGDRTVIVVTGVGKLGQGTLRRLVPEWLGRSDLRALVSGYAQAHRSHGGAGAYYVFLKRRIE